MNNYTIDKENKRITINDISKITPKKISGTNFSVILGANTFSTPFQIWCEMMRIYKKPFETSPELNAGKIIEPKQAEYIREKYSVPGLLSPEDKFGKNYLQKTSYDFFPLDAHFQGMWDYINTNPETGQLRSIFEMKTTKEKNRDKWLQNIPEYYLLQVGLYTYLSSVDKMAIVATFLAPEDYEHPEDFKPNDSNTVLIPYRLSSLYPNFYETKVKPAIEWWDKYIVSGVSPEYDENNPGDMEVINALMPKSPIITPNEFFDDESSNISLEEKLFY